MNATGTRARPHPTPKYLPNNLFTFFRCFVPLLDHAVLPTDGFRAKWLTGPTSHANSWQPQPRHPIRVAGVGRYMFIDSTSKLAAESIRSKTSYIWHLLLVVYWSLVRQAGREVGSTSLTQYSVSILAGRKLCDFWESRGSSS